MSIDRRDFMKFSALSAFALPLGQQKELPKPIAELKPMTGGAKPITRDEYLQRQETARRCMHEAGIDAVLLAGGSSLFYFTGARWGTSERMFAMIFPAKGEPGWVTPAFEKGRALEQIKFGSDVRTWEEDESPYQLAASILRDRGIVAGHLGVEETVDFRFSDGVAKAAPALKITSADPVTARCRRVKSSHEIELIRLANQITLRAFEAAVMTLREGITHYELGANIAAAHQKLGIQGGALVLFGEHSASPHGTVTPQKLREGDIVLIDGGGSVEGYSSDITRTTVFGKPSDRQLRVWEIEHRAQAAALRAARAGAACEDVDAAARKVIVDAGFGPGYKYFTHRVGHGIGLDGHEWTYLVRGNKTKLEPGMTFSNEPGIYIPGEFGVRLEDIMVITENGAELMTGQAASITHPFISMPGSERAVSN
ncbi:MAG TPA: Xaa-Pro peptidase family protein [Blastocatellia bacterium]|nr:Xaa-Pro peptidase family protein [Blastocatellia bacterium]